MIMLSLIFVTMVGSIHLNKSFVYKRFPIKTIFCPTNGLTHTVCTNPISDIIEPFAAQRLGLRWLETIPIIMSF